MSLIRFFFFFLLLIGKSFAFEVNSEPNFRLSLKDSTGILDSLQYRNNQNKKLKQQRRILKVASLISAFLAVGNAIKPAENAWAMLYFGIISIGAFILSLTIKRPIGYFKDLNKEIKIYKWKKYEKLNKSWLITFFTGFLAMFLIVFSEFSLFHLTIFGYFLPAFFIILLIASFILGFFGKYESKRKMSKRFVMAVLGLFLPFLPTIVLVSLFFIFGRE
jgi:membrane-associated HD superfamily phosphohydrolase